MVMNKETIKFLGFSLIFALCCPTVFSACSNIDDSKEKDSITAIADKEWAFSQSHPDRFTLDIRTLTEPTEGIAVSYAESQDSHLRDQLNKVVTHALGHDGYVGGWLNTENGLYFFDSTKLFPETSLKDAFFVRKGERPAIGIHPLHPHRYSS